jgi:hypothetical protein
MRACVRALHRTVTQVTSLAGKLASLTAKGTPFEEAWGALTLKACKTGQSHIMHFMLRKFQETVEINQQAHTNEAGVLGTYTARYLTHWHTSSRVGTGMSCHVMSCHGL